MAKADGKKERKERPLLQLGRVTHKELKTKVKTPTHEQIGRYIEYYRQATGTKPEVEEVVDGAIAGFFKADRGFQKFLKSGKGAMAGDGINSSAPEGASEGE